MLALVGTSVLAGGAAIGRSGVVGPTAPLGEIVVLVKAEQGPGPGGKVTSNPPGIDCPGRCRWAFTDPDVTLTASPASDYKFVRWERACSGAGANPVCTLRLAAPATFVIAVFTQEPTASPPPAKPKAPPPKPKPCKCTKLSTAIDPSLLQEQRLPRGKQDFGVGFTWTMTCNAGKGRCRGRVRFLPPEILAGSLPEPKENLKLNVKRATIECDGQCNKVKTGRFEIKMRATDQLNELFGRTLAFTLKRYCIVKGKEVLKGTTRVRVRIDQTGRMSRA